MLGLTFLKLFIGSVFKSCYFGGIFEVINPQHLQCSSKHQSDVSIMVLIFSK